MYIFFWKCIIWNIKSNLYGQCTIPPRSGPTRRKRSIIDSHEIITVQKSLTVKNSPSDSSSFTICFLSISAIFTLLLWFFPSSKSIMPITESWHKKCPQKNKVWCSNNFEIFAKVFEVFAICTARDNLYKIIIITLYYSESLHPLSNGLLFELQSDLGILRWDSVLNRFVEYAKYQKCPWSAKR